VDYAHQLLSAIAETTSAAKAVALRAIPAPVDGATWPMPEVPRRPGRDPALRETEDPPRRRRGLADPAARRRFMHAIHHIELSAIDLAALTCLRAIGAPRALHEDFLAIAREEAEHAALLEGWLAANGCASGAFPIHHRLWDAAAACGDLGEQLVVVPRFLEARGLDVSAGIIPRLSAVDAAAGAVIARIYRDEIRHVAVGTRWHTWWCRERRLDPVAHFAEVVRRRFPEQLPSPFALDRGGRGQAGFAAEELSVLEGPAP
jgi:uncharacterized ferritin-like protein (DUF455 family)